MSSYSKEELQYFEILIEKDPLLKVWTTKDGQRIPVCMMKDSHLDNVIKHLKARMELCQKQYIRDYFKIKIYEFENEKLMRLVNKTRAGKILYGRKKI